MVRAAAEIAAEVRMRRTQHPGSLLLVEGSLDSRVFRQFTDPSCRVVVAGGRDNVQLVVRRLASEGFPGIAGVMDADFGRIEGGLPADPDLLILDVHDIEVMLLSSRALDRVLASLADDTRIADFLATGGRTVREAVVDVARPLGAFRLLSQRERLDLRFEGLNFARFVDPSTLDVDPLNMVKEVGRKSQRPRLDAVDLVSQIGEVIRDGHDWGQLCCGHDLIDALGYGLRHLWARRNAREVEPTRLALALGYAFDLDEWLATTLCGSMRQWAERNSGYRLASETSSQL